MTASYDDGRKSVGVGRLARVDQERADAEDRIYMQIDKLISLCSVQSALDSGDCMPESINRGCLSLLIEDQVRELRRLLDTVFE